MAPVVGTIPHCLLAPTYSGKLCNMEIGVNSILRSLVQYLVLNPTATLAVRIDYIQQ